MKCTRMWLGALAAAALLCAYGTHANNLGFLKNTASALLTDEDRELQRAAIMVVLEDPNAKSAKDWKNPHSGHSGSIQSLGNYRSDDALPCRKLKISNQADGLKNEATYPVCKTTSGEWIAASGKKLTKANEQ
jgi:surface antigen